MQSSDYSIVTILVKGHKRSFICVTDDVQPIVSSLFKPARESATNAPYDLVAVAKAVMVDAEPAAQSTTSSKSDEVVNDNLSAYDRFRQLGKAGVRGIKFQGGVITNNDGTLYVE